MSFCWWWWWQCWCWCRWRQCWFWWRWWQNWLWKSPMWWSLGILHNAEQTAPCNTGRNTAGPPCNASSIMDESPLWWTILDEQSILWLIYFVNFHWRHQIRALICSTTWNYFSAGNVSIHSVNLSIHLMKLTNSSELNLFELNVLCCPLSVLVRRKTDNNRQTSSHKNFASCITPVDKVSSIISNQF